ncbi:hypothetical protein IE077_000418 [Cardiosporidium cionae]|uniref:Uncharacterized protein n=1 Tax=Cardiosporidium cionae TaxID=476202 RepID=A0ABQ7J4F8_9APIC|nr:hypothetical protein IE077_000418 [Cardiosporidium cionae]|eukprot:KAF8817916.1 hypothetical protein IE077_000418 [Cardiosporidium cionae]
MRFSLLYLCVSLISYFILFYILFFIFDLKGYYLEKIEGETLLNKWMTCFKMHQENGNYSKRIVYKIQDLLDLKDNGWSKKIFKEKAKTVAQIHEDAYEDELKGGSIVSVQAGIYALIGGTDPQPYHHYLVQQHILYQTKRHAKNSLRETPSTSKEHFPPPPLLPSSKDILIEPPRTGGVSQTNEKKERCLLPSSGVDGEGDGGSNGVETNPSDDSMAVHRADVLPETTKQESGEFPPTNSPTRDSSLLSPQNSLIETLQRFSSSADMETSLKKILDIWSTYRDPQEKAEEFISMCDWIFRTEEEAIICMKYSKIFHCLTNDLSKAASDTSSTFLLINQLFECINKHFQTEPPEEIFSFVGHICASLLMALPSPFSFHSSDASLRLIFPSVQTVAISCVVAMHRRILHQNEILAEEFWEFGKQQLCLTFENLTMEELHEIFDKISLAEESTLNKNNSLKD